jgi:hypothetical protein
VLVLREEIQREALGLRGEIQRVVLVRLHAETLYSLCLPRSHFHQLNFDLDLEKEGRSFWEFCLLSVRRLDGLGEVVRKEDGVERSPLELR